MRASIKIDKEKDRVMHPGWAVQFEDGTWLGGAHGWFRSEDPFYADVYESEKDAQRYLDDLRKDKDEQGYYNLPAQIVPAWQPLCENLRHEVRTLTKANKLTPSKIMDITDHLEDALRELKNYDE
jgi:hypothetical protein